MRSTGCGELGDVAAEHADLADALTSGVEPRASFRSALRDDLRQEFEACAADADTDLPEVGGDAGAQTDDHPMRGPA